MGGGENYMEQEGGGCLLVSVGGACLSFRVSSGQGLGMEPQVNSLLSQALE